MLIRRITIAALAAALTGAVLVLPAAAKSGPQAVAAKKAKKCKKGKKGKKKRCKKGGSGGPSGGGGGIPGQATPSSPTPPDDPNIPSDLEIADLEVAASHVYGGDSTTGQVRVDAPAPDGGQQVDLESNSPRASVPDTVTVQPGQTTAGFAVTTTTGPVAPVTLTASIGGSQDTAQLTVVDTASVASVKLERQCFTASVNSYNSNRVSLDVPAPEDTEVDLVSSQPLSLNPTLDSVMVPEGSTTAFFGVDALSATTGNAVITATLDGLEATDTAAVYASTPDPTATGLAVDPDVIDVGGSTHGTVTLDCEALSGTTVQFSSSDPKIVVPAGPQPIPEDALSFTFLINATAAPVGDYTIHATVGGVTQNAQLTVTTLGT